MPFRPPAPAHPGIPLSLRWRGVCWYCLKTSVLTNRLLVRYVPLRFWPSESVYQRTPLHRRDRGMPGWVGTGGRNGIYEGLVVTNLHGFSIKLIDKNSSLLYDKEHICMSKGVHIVLGTASLFGPYERSFRFDKPFLSKDRS